MSSDPTPRLYDPSSDPPWHDRFLDRIRSAWGLVVMSDFDGTIAEIEAYPADARVRPDAREAMARLRDHSQVDVAVVSGRALEEVRRLVGLDGIGYAGNHGLEIRIDDRSYVHPAAEGTEDVIDAVCEELADRLGDVDGAIIENKGLTATVHHRLIDDDETVGRVRETVRSSAARYDAIRAHDGKSIVELRPAVDWDKGRAVRWLLQRTRSGATSVPIYLGDDETDEAAFEALSETGIGIAVGADPRRTNASFVLDGPPEVVDVLEWLARAVRAGS